MKRRIFAILTVVTCMAFLVVGCGSKEETTEPTETIQTEDTEDTAPTEETEMETETEIETETEVETETEIETESETETEPKKPVAEQPAEQPNETPAQPDTPPEESNNELPSFPYELNKLYDDGDKIYFYYIAGDHTNYNSLSDQATSILDERGLNTIISNGGNGSYTVANSSCDDPLGAVGEYKEGGVLCITTYLTYN